MEPLEEFGCNANEINILLLHVYIIITIPSQNPLPPSAPIPNPAANNNSTFYGNSPTAITNTSAGVSTNMNSNALYINTSSNNNTSSTTASSNTNTMNEYPTTTNKSCSVSQCPKFITSIGFTYGT